MTAIISRTPVTFTRLSHDAMPDPAGFERASYMRTLMSWSSRHQVSPDQPTR